MGKRNAVAAGRFWKICAIGLGVAAFSNAASAQYLNSADVYEYPFGLASNFDHQVKAWNSAALQDAQDAAFYYSDAAPAQPEAETVVDASPAMTQASGPIGPMPVATPLPDTVPQVADFVARSNPATAVTVAATDQGKPMSDADKAAVIRQILKQYATKGIDADAAVALMADVLNASKKPPESLAPVVAARPAVVVSAAPAVQVWPIRQNATVQETLAQWANLAGWKPPKWNAETETPYRITAGKPFSGTFMDALRVLSDAAPQFDINVKAASRELVVSDAAH